jgi:hypothetical protein
VYTRLRRNERLAIKRLQQTGVRDCQEPLLQKSSKRTLNVPSTLRTDGIGMGGTRERRRQSCRHQSRTLKKKQLQLLVSFVRERCEKGGPCQRLALVAGQGRLPFTA